MIRLAFNHLPIIAAFTDKHDFSFWSHDQLQECLLYPDYQGWMVEVKGIPVAYVLVNMVGEEVHLMHMATHPEYRQQGYGRNLLKLVIEKITCLKKQKIILEVNSHNILAIKLYEKVGFQLIGKRKSYYRVGVHYEDALVYELKL